MTLRRLIGVGTRLVVAFSIGSAVGMHGQENVPTFKSGIDLVRVSAIVRDQKGRFVKDLSMRDFEVTDGGIAKTISDFRRDGAAISVVLLFDVSGSMQNTLPEARESGMHLLSWLGPEDEAAVFTFDTQLKEVAPFTAGLRQLPGSMATVMPFGATSLHDAIARTAERVGTREGRRRAVVVFSDGRDNASRLRIKRRVRHRQLDRRAGLPVRGRSVDRQPGNRVLGKHHQFVADRAAQRPRNEDRRPRVCREHSSHPQRGGPADCGRAPASVSDRV